MRIINADRISKSYHIWASPLARLQGPAFQSVANLPFLPAHWRQSLRAQAQDFAREFFALRNVSFQVNRGQSVGIVGRNGSGKSTLLQIITGTLQPTSGQAEICGRVAALLELGSGFNPEFTGRENVRLNAALHGLTPDEIEARLEEMLAFADIGEFVDQPVKTYSSGMMLRLAFSVVAHIDADILIIDEALAVGDAAFSRKCIARIERFQAEGGSLLLVSHDPGMILALCDHALLLERGELLLAGSPKLVTGQYLKLVFAPPDAYENVREAARLAVELPAEEDVVPTASAPTDAPTKSSGVTAHYVPGLVSQSVVTYASRGALIRNPRIEDQDGREVNVLIRGERYTYVYEVFFSETCFQVRCGMLIKTMNGIELGGAVTSTSRDSSLPFAPAGSTQEVRFDFNCNLLPSNYFLNAGVEGLLDGCLQYLHRALDLYMFRVLDESDLTVTGMVDFGTESQIRELTPERCSLAAAVL